MPSIFYQLLFDIKTWKQVMGMVYIAYTFNPCLFGAWQLIELNFVFFLQILEAADKIQATDMKKHALSMIVQHFPQVRYCFESSTGTK